MKKEEGPFLENALELFLTGKRMGVTETSVMERKWKEAVGFCHQSETVKIKRKFNIKMQPIF